MTDWILLLEPPGLGLCGDYTDLMMEAVVVRTLTLARQEQTSTPMKEGEMRWDAHLADCCVYENQGAASQGLARFGWDEPRNLPNQTALRARTLRREARCLE